MIQIYTRHELPECLRRFKQVKGLCIGGCVSELGRNKTPLTDCLKNQWVAHAHSSIFDANNGIICSYYKEAIYDKQTLLHEAAHIITKEGHTKAWKKCLLEIGGTLSSTRVGYGPFHSAREYYSVCELSFKEKILKTFEETSKLVIKKINPYFDR